MSNYQSEIKAFRDNFKEFKDKKIVLYGIGRYTATLLEGVEDYYFVGLMDKDKSRQGSTLFGLPIVSLKEAEKEADLIIINTAETYWQVIYSRISDSKIPIFFINGELAKKTSFENVPNPYTHLTFKEMREMALRADIVSFDFFDTLFSRAISNPRDVFALVPVENERRIEAKKRLGKYYTLTELYKEMGLSLELMQREIEIEHSLMMPREPVLEFFRELISQKKDVYIVSDMYLSSQFYIDELKKYNITMPEDHVIVSCEHRAGKDNGSLWEYYEKKIVNGRNAYHIGDNQLSDIENANRYGINTYWAPNAWDLTLNSSMQSALGKSESLYDSSIFGIWMAKMGSNPFVFENDNTPQICTNEELGYFVFGPVVLTFLLWLEKNRINDGISQLLFLARDGYLLKEDYDFLKKLLGKSSDDKYLVISRQLARLASCETREDVIEYLSQPYSGNVRELFEDRLMFEISGEDDDIETSVEKYWDEIKLVVQKTREKYLEYLTAEIADASVAIVDQGYYGNNQRYLSKLLGKEVSGYYFCANLSEENNNALNQKMKACFQQEQDEKGENSSILKYMIYLESFMTAPFGMAKAMSEKGEFIYAEKRENQKRFDAKIEINNGVKQFIKDYINIYGMQLSVTTGLVDKIYLLAFNGGLNINDEVKKSFYNDNGFMNREESALFY